MRTLIVTEFVSLDGVIDSPGGEPGYAHTGWTFDIEQDPTMYEFKLAEQLAAETLLLGRVTFEAFRGAWPERDGEFADKINTMEKYVVSATVTDPVWDHSTVIGFDDVAALKDGDGGPILVAGSATLVHALAKAGLVDQWNLMVFPVILGSGKRLFPTDAVDKLTLSLTEQRTYANGVQLQTFTAA